MIVISVRFPTIILLCVCFILAAAGFDVAGFYSNHLDIGAQYAGALLGLTNGISSFSGMVIPLLTGAIVLDQHVKAHCALYSYLFLRSLVKIGMEHRSRHSHLC